MHKLAQLDHAHVWHPFTQMRDWLKREPVVITSGKGAVLRDIHGKEYLDANSSIWTNLHGHQHPKINAAIARQLKKISHSSALGFANEPASLLAAELVRSAEHCSASWRRDSCGAMLRAPHLNKAFFSDDGSTALEVALKNLPSDRDDYTVAIALLTDGQSDTAKLDEFKQQYASDGKGVPIFSIMFGDADSQQLNDLAKLSNGKVFDGRNGNLSGIFREVKGYN